MSYDTPHPKTLSEKACKKWATAAADEVNFIVSPPRLRNTTIHEGQDEVITLLLTRELAAKIRNALCLGRSYQQFSRAAEAHIERYRTQGLDAVALVESTDFRLQLKKKKGIEQGNAVSDAQAEELDVLGQGLIRYRHNQERAVENRSLLQDDVKKERDAWRDAWFEVDKILDPVWIDPGFIKPYPNPNPPTDERGKTSNKRRRGSENEAESVGDDDERGKSRKPPKVLTSIKERQ
jgi:hypothetical protein